MDQNLPHTISFLEKRIIMKSTLIILVLVTALPGCKKQTNAEENIVNFLTTGTWRITAHTYRNALGFTNSYDATPDCSKDNYYRFNKDGTEEINEGATKCNSTDPQTRFFQWKFLNQYNNKIEIAGWEYSFHKLDDARFEIITWFTVLMLRLPT